MRGCSFIETISRRITWPATVFSALFLDSTSHSRLYQAHSLKGPVFETSSCNDLNTAPPENFTWRPSHYTVCIIPLGKHILVWLETWLLLTSYIKQISNMATKAPLSMADGPFDDKKQVDEEAPVNAVEPGQLQQEILGVLDLDPALNSKMHLVNNVCRPCLILSATSVSGVLSGLLSFWTSVRAPISKQSRTSRLPVLSSRPLLFALNFANVSCHQHRPWTKSGGHHITGSCSL